MSELHITTKWGDGPYSSGNVKMLHEFFDKRLIVCSLSITLISLLSFFFWEYLKDRVYRNHLQTLAAVRVKIAQEVSVITLVVVQHIPQNMGAVC